MTDAKTTVSFLRSKVRRFINERDWEQFHSPKNVAMSIAIEAAELMEHFQWTYSKKLEAGKAAELNRIEEEVADIAMYVFDLCNVLGIDLSTAIERKLVHNRKKYPAAQVRGKSHKYTYYQSRESGKVKTAAPKKKKK